MVKKYGPWLQKNLAKEGRAGGLIFIEKSAKGDKNILSPAVIWGDLFQKGVGELHQHKS